MVALLMMVHVMTIIIKYTFSNICQLNVNWELMSFIQENMFKTSSANTGDLNMLESLESHLTQANQYCLNHALNFDEIITGVNELSKISSGVT